MFDNPLDEVIFEYEHVFILLTIRKKLIYKKIYIFYIIYVYLHNKVKPRKN